MKRLPLRMPRGTAIVRISAIVACVSLASAAIGQAEDHLPKNDARPEAGKEQMHFVLVFKCHFDIGYSALARDVVHEYQTTMIDRALDVMESHGDQFSWTVPGWPMWKILWDGQSPERRKRIQTQIRSGRLVMHGVPASTHTGSLELEELVRGLWFASDVSRRCGLEVPRDGKMTDVPGHCWILPVLLKHAGLVFFHSGGNPTNQPVRVPLLFWWEGPDGSRLLCMFTRGYAGGLFPPADWKHQTWLSLVAAGDNAGPPSAKEVQGYIAQIRSKYPKARITVGRLSDFADSLLAENPDLPVVRGDISDSWIHGVMSSPRAAKIARRVRPLLPALETLHTQSSAWGLQHVSIQPDLMKAYENSLMWSEHTWGLANQHFVPGLTGKAWYRMYASGLDPAYERMEESWNEHDQYIMRVKDWCIPVMERELHTLAENVDTGGLRITVYNPLPWKRSGLVRFALPFMGSLPGRSVSPVGGDDVEPLACYGADSKRIGAFFASDIPGSGYRTYVVNSRQGADETGDLRADLQRSTIENRWFTVRFDAARGVVGSIVNKATGAELVDQNAPHGFGQYLYQRFSRQESQEYLNHYVFREYGRSHDRITAKVRYLPPDVPHTDFSPTGMEFDVERARTFISGTLYPKTPREENAHNAALRVTLYKDTPAIDLKVSIINKPATEIPEAGWICLPFAVEDPTFRIGRLGSVIDPETDLLFGSQCNFIWSNSGVTVGDKAGKGVGICPIDSPAVAFGRPDFMKFKPKFENLGSALYVHLFNNRWNTNFRSFWSGNLCSEVRIWTFENFDIGRDLVVPAWEARLPLAAGLANCRAGRLPSLRSGLSLSRTGVLVTAFGENPDGDNPDDKGEILRLWESTGKSSKCTVWLPEGMAKVSAQPVDLRGRPNGNVVTIKDGRFSVDLHGFSPKSFILK